MTRDGMRKFKKIERSRKAQRTMSELVYLEGLENEV
jgi:hypothetical protein